MKVKITQWNAVATWRWNIPEDDVCGICQVHFDGTCPTCKYPGDDCALQFEWTDQANDTSMNTTQDLPEV
ncbi:ubiquitin-protein ligase Anaphase Promoting Complex [Collariella sp. IMI 366227]|nr:ubiquitin-protein ligase Anaphase Promoting Complex [Collariella sp. IMI 366227]